MVLPARKFSGLDWVDDGFVYPVSQASPQSSYRKDSDPPVEWEWSEQRGQALDFRQRKETPLLSSEEFPRKMSRPREVCPLLKVIGF